VAKGKTLQSYTKLFKELEAKGPRPVYFLYGPEEHTKREYLRAVVAAVLPEDKRAFNLDILHGDEFDKEAFNNRMSAFPLFAERRVVVIKKFEALATADKDFVLKRLEAGALPDGTVLVVEAGDLADGKLTVRTKKVIDFAKQNGVAVEFALLRREESEEWVRQKLAQAGVAVDPEAARLLVESVGEQLIDLANEVEKLAAYVGNGGRVTTDTVASVVGRYRTEEPWAFTESLGRKDTADLLRRMNKLLEGGVEPVVILGTLLRNVIQMLQVKLLVDEGTARGPRDVGAHLGRQPWLAGRLLEQAARFRQEELELYLENLRWADIRLKSTATSPRTIVETAVVASSQGKRLALSNI